MNQPAPVFKLNKRFMNFIIENLIAAELIS